MQSSLNSFSSVTTLVLEGLTVFHRRSIEYTLACFFRDLQLYSELTPLGVGLQKAISSVTIPKLLIWIIGKDEVVLSQSASLNMTSATTLQSIFSLTTMPSRPRVRQIDQQYFILYSRVLSVSGTVIGRVCIAQNITDIQEQLIVVLRSLIFVCLMAALRTGAIALQLFRVLRSSLLLKTYSV